jgi:hypothetical protein
MPQFNVIFKDCPALEISIAETALGYQYANLVKTNYNQEFPIFRDTTQYTVDRMLELAQEAKEAFGWDWSADEYHIGITALLHKDLEVLLANGFDSIPAQYDHLIHELHYCLHCIEFGASGNRGWLQIEWYNDSGFELFDKTVFKPNLKFGDIRLQNPYVGHNVHQILGEQDYSKISQTCKFHDFVKPGFDIVITAGNNRVHHPEKVIEIFNTHAPDFVAEHGEEKIISYIGEPCIGSVANLDALEQVIAMPKLELERIDFE